MRPPIPSARRVPVPGLSPRHSPVTGLTRMPHCMYLSFAVLRHCVPVAVLAKRTISMVHIRGETVERHSGSVAATSSVQRASAPPGIQKERLGATCTGHGVTHNGRCGHGRDRPRYQRFRAASAQVSGKRGRPDRRWPRVGRGGRPKTVSRKLARHVRRESQGSDKAGTRVPGTRQRIVFTYFDINN